MGCKVCEVLARENEHLRKWIDRLMDERVPDPDPQITESIPQIEEATDPLKEAEVFGQ